MKTKTRPERLPRWKDCAVFGISGFTLCLSIFLAGKTDAAVYYSTRVGFALAVLMVVTVIRQRSKNPGKDR